MASVKELLTVAAKQLGITEWPVNSNKVKYNTWYYGREVSGSDYPWCMAFVQWCYAEAGMRLPYKTASCGVLLNWYKQHHPECVVTHPEPGDIVIYDFPGGGPTDHTGIIESAAIGKITAIEGNTTSGSSGSQSNGGGVYRRTRSTSCVRAYIRPITAMQIETEDDDMTQDKFNQMFKTAMEAYHKELRDNMTQDKFNQMFKTAMEAYHKELRDNDSGKWSAEARQWAVDTGLIAGNGTTPDGSPNFMWEDHLTREQLVTVLHRYSKLTGKA